MSDQRLFIGKYPCGLVYADTQVEVHGDYKRLGFLPYDTLKLELYGAMPRHLREQIELDAAGMLSRAGEEYQVSTCGQTVRLGTKLS